MTINNCPLKNQTNSNEKNYFNALFKHQNCQFNWESRTAYLGFMYRFGGGKNKKRSRKNRDDNETQGGGFMN